VGLLLAVACGLAPTTRASAQAEGWGSEEAAEEAEAKEAENAESAPEEAGSAPADDALPAPPNDAPNDGLPKRGAATQHLLGLRYRGIIIPKTVLNWFVDGGQTVYVNGFGPELAIRDGKLEYILSAWLSLYGMSPVAIKGTSDEEEAWEIVESDMKSLYLTADYLWHARLAKGLELSYGGGAGIGFLFGDLNRTQAALPQGGTRGNPDDYVPCDAEGMPSVNYCDDINDHYDGYGEPNWFHGGTKPALFPWLAAQVGLRYQPHEKLVTRLDLGIGTSGLFFGLGADYGL
jgi:hypothetical protein